MSPCKLFYVVLCIAGSVLLHQVSAQELQCTVVLSRRVSCGGGTLEQCGNRGCCYDDSAPSAEIPSCYFPLNEVPRFSEWKSWSSCSRSCGSEGRITRERSCEYPDGRIAPSDLCFGTDFEEQQCNRVACPGVQLATTVSAAVSAQGTSSASPTCEDSLGDSCERFKSLCGGSGSLSNSLQRFCRKTCNLCGDDAGVDAGADAPTKSSSTTASTTTTTLPPTKYPLTVCEDEYDTCNRVKDLCDEPEHSEDLRRYCRRTCNMCLTTTTTTTTTTEKSCVDGNSERCARFSTFCSTPNIQQFCPKTCGTCKEDNDLVTSPQTSVQTTSLVTVILTTPLPTTTTTTRRPVQVPSVNRNPGNNVVNNLVCRDDLDFCTKVDGLCENTIYRSVWQQCRLTCGLCDPNQSADSARATGVCVDELHYCNILQPVCNDLQYEPMTSKCPQTCNRCSSPARRPQQPPSPGFTPIRQPPSTIRQPPSTIRQPPSTIRQPPSTIRQPPTTIRQPPATTLTQIFVTQPTTTTTPPTTTPPTTTTTTTATTPPTTTSLITSTSEPTSTNEPEMPGDNTRTTISTTEEPLKAECKDVNPRCSEVATFCGLPAYKKTLEITCALTCGKCSQETTDTAKTESSDVSTESSATTTTIQSAFSTTDATTTSKEIDECKDQFDICSKWKGSDLCQRLNTLKRSCPGTCNSCVDGKNPFAVQSTPPPSTTTTPRVTMTTTRRTTTTLDPSVCADAFPSICGRFKDSPRCQNTESLQRDCKKSCGLC